MEKLCNSNQTLEAVVIRTLPNSDSKKQTKWSESNPPYFTPQATQYLREKSFKHLLVDLPSVDREHDEGKLPAHRAFWGTENVFLDQETNMLLETKTITELIYVPPHIEDGYYYLNLQISPFDCDAAPSRPVLIPQECLRLSSSS